MPLSHRTHDVRSGTSVLTARNSTGRAQASPRSWPPPGLFSGVQPLVLSLPPQMHSLTLFVFAEHTDASFSISVASAPSLRYFQAIDSVARLTQAPLRSGSLELVYTFI